MAMHADDARDDRIAAQIEHRDIGTLWLVRSTPDRRDLAIFDLEVLIGPRRRSGAVDDSHVFEDYLGRADADVLAHLGAQNIGRLGTREL
jgi:hypothetical protein